MAEIDLCTHRRLWKCYQLAECSVTFANGKDLRKYLSLHISFYNSSTTQNGSWLAQQFPSSVPSFRTELPKLFIFMIWRSCRISSSHFFLGRPLGRDDNVFKELFPVLFSLHAFFPDVPTVQVSDLLYTLQQYFFVSKECLFVRVFSFSERLDQQ
jgi:hypothetical protein